MCRTCFSFDVFSCNLSVVFFFKQKTAYEMRISDWSSDVCSSDLSIRQRRPFDSPASPALRANGERNPHSAHRALKRSDHKTIVSRVRPLPPFVPSVSRSEMYRGTAPLDPATQTL